MSEIERRSRVYKRGRAREGTGNRYVKSLLLRLEDFSKRPHRGIEGNMLGGLGEGGLVDASPVSISRRSEKDSRETAKGNLTMSSGGGPGWRSLLWSLFCASELLPSLLRLESLRRWKEKCRTIPWKSERGTSGAFHPGGNVKNGKLG